MNPTLPLFQSLQLRKTVAFFLCLFALSCPPMEDEEWGEIFREGRGNRKCDMMMMGMMMKWLTFYILYTTAFCKLEGNTKLLFCLYFCFLGLLLCSLHTLLLK
jgi:hypothetical protein